jgi:hypothetical protein
MERALLGNAWRSPRFSLQAQKRKILSTALLAGAWILALSIGLRALANYENAPGKTGTTPDSWPAASRIPRAPERATLVMLAHPHCPCTRASVGELAQIMAGVQGKVAAYVLLLKPKNSPPDWDDTDLRHSAACIPGVMVMSDVDGEEAARFGAETSGHALLFDSKGHRLFSGGITASRGHAGDNAGENAIEALINNQASKLKSTLVFGCSLSGKKPKGADTSCRR